MLLLATVLALSTTALLPDADARQACTYGGGDPCDDRLACAWDRVNGKWVCVGEIHCDPTYCDPWWP